MATANDLIEAAARALGWRRVTVEAYALALRRNSWWPPTKRGRGAAPVDEMHAAKLVLALLSTGPREMAAETPGTDEPWFRLYANLQPQNPDDAAHAAVRRLLGLDREATFIDYLAGIIGLFAMSEAEQLIDWRPDPEGFADPWAYKGPEVEVRVQSPFPIGQIKFCPSIGLALPDSINLTFLHWIYRLHVEEKNIGNSSDSTEPIIHRLREETAFGVHVERKIDGRLLAALGKTLEKQTNSP